MSLKSIYTPSEWGKSFHATKTDQCLGAGAAGPGKALALDTLVPTNKGLKKLEEIKYGDIVFNRFGEQTKVLAISEIWDDRKCYELTIDNRSIVASDNHLWVVGKGRVFTTEEIYDHAFEVNIPKAHAIRLNPIDFSVDPYLAGICLFKSLKEDPSKISIWNPEILYRLYKTKHRPAIRGIAGGLIQVIGLRLPENLIRHYCDGSIRQRLDFLAGVTDSCENINLGFFNDESGNRTNDFFFLCASLGLSPKVLNWGKFENPQLKLQHPKIKLTKVTNSSFDIIPRGNRHFTVTDCKPVDSVPVRCIQVEGDNTFLITPSCIVTHNSLVLLMDPMEQVMVEHHRCKQGELPDSYDANLKTLIKNNPLRWGDSAGWALHMRRTMPMLKQTISRAHKMFPKIDPKVDWNQKDSIFTFSSGYKFQFGHCEHKHSFQNYVSNEYTHLALDELIQFFKDQHDNLDTRVRTSDEVLRYFLKNRSASNPMMGDEESTKKIERDDPRWVKHYYIDPAPEGKTIIRKKIVRKDGSIKYDTRIYLPATLYDNPDKEFVAQYEAKLLGKPKHIRDCYLYGKWDAVVGAHFGNEWNPDIHVCKPFRIPEHWPIFRSMDWGYKTHGCIHYFAVDEEGRLYVWYEFIFRNKSAKYVASDIIKPFEQKNKLWDSSGSKLQGPADTQLWEERGESAQNKAMDMADEGVNWVHADKRDRGANSTRISERLVDHDNFTKQPMLIFFENCVSIRQVLPAASTDPSDPEAWAKGGYDHPLDTLAYGVAYAQQTGLTAPERRGAKLLEEEDDLLTANSRGRWGWGGYA